MTTKAKLLCWMCLDNNPNCPNGHGCRGCGQIHAQSADCIEIVATALDKEIADWAIPRQAFPEKGGADADEAGRSHSLLDSKGEGPTPSPHIPGVTYRPFTEEEREALDADHREYDARKGFFKPSPGQAQEHITVGGHDYVHVAACGCPAMTKAREEIARERDRDES